MSNISFIIKKPKAKVVSYYAGGAIALGVATSGFFHDYFLIGIIALFGVLGIIAGLEGSYGRTEVSQGGVQYAIVYGVIPLWKRSISQVKSMTIDGTTATIKGNTAREVIMLTKLSSKDIQRLQEMHEKYWSKNSQHQVIN